MKRSGAAALAGAVLVCAVLGSLAQGADPIVATPVLSMPGGTYNAELMVEISCTTPGATIRYTLDGSDPNSGAEIVSGTSILIDHSLMLRAVGLMEGMSASPGAQASYILIAATPVFSKSGGSYDTEPNVIVTCATPGAIIHYTTNGEEPTESDPVIASGSTITVDRSLTLKAKAWKGVMTPSAVKSATYTLVAAIPAFSKSGGTYNTEQTVTISCATLGATIHYTTNGEEPTESDPVIASGSTITVDRSLTLKAKAWKGAMTPSAVQSATYTLVVSTPTFSKSSGTYNIEQTVFITCATAGATIHYTTNGEEPTESDPVIASGSSIPVDHSLTLKVRAWKEGWDPSAVKSATYTLVVSTPTFSKSGGTYNTEQTVVITCATAGATIHYTTNGVDPTESDPVIASGDSIIVDHSLTLKARAWKGVMTPSAVKSATYTLVVSTPTFSKSSGTYNTEQTVTISCTTPGATIHYTTNGVDPTESDPVIAAGGSIIVDHSLTLKARAWKEGFSPSAVRSATYTLVTGTPVFSKAEGTYNAGLMVEITCATPGATIRYTVDGSDPNDGVIYEPNVPVVVDHTLTLKAKAWREGLPESAVRTVVYTLIAGTPVFSKAGGTYHDELMVEISCATTGATIRYTLDGSDPNDGVIYDPGTPVYVDRTLTLKAKAWKGDLTPSVVQSATYTLVAATPEFTPDGGYYSEDQIVTITCATPGVTIYYTTDGSDPTVDSLGVENGWTIPVTVDPATVLKATAYKGNFQPSSIKQASYRLLDIIYVNAVATGANTGTSWADAYTSLQSGLDVADPNSPAEIWVAAGTYKPTKEVGGTGPRYRAFQLKNGVGVYGGFNGTESRRDQRDWEANPTILSGDLNGNDNDHIASDEPTRQDNCYHVFCHNEVNALDGTAILDGFVITSGNGPGFDGGGMYNISSSPTVTHCLFRNNSADYGGGMYNKSSKPKVTDCIFTNNQGGGMCNVSSSPTVTDCLFSNNSAKYGGGMYNYVSSYPTVTHCLFNNNLADDDGGGMSNERTSSPKVTDCIFSNNSAKRGGGMYIYSSNQSVTRCLFSNNSAEYGGGGIYFWDKYQYTSLTVTNCLFINNSTKYGGGGISGTGQITSIINCTFTGNSAVYDGGGIRSSNLQAVNSIFWGNNARTGPQLDGYCKVTYSNIQGGWAGEGGGNIDADPLFVDAANGDFRLQASSPCIDKGSNAAIPAGVAADMDGTPRIVDGNCDGNAVVDMGAYEYFLIGDLNSNCGVDMTDFDIFAGQWQRDDCTSPANCGQADIDRNGVVEWEDFVQFAEQWLQSENILPPPPLPLPIAWWTMDETEGTLVSDSIGGYHGQTVNSTGNPWVAGHSGNALLLDGVDDYVTLPAGILNPAQTPFSVFAWIRLDAKATNYQAIVEQVDDAAGIGRTWLLRDKSDYLQSSIGGSGTISNQAVFSTLNQWHHVGLTYNGQTVTLYIDGFSAGSASQTAEGCTGPLLIGRHKTDETTYWNGAIDDVRIYDVALTPQQVSQLARE